MNGADHAVLRLVAALAAQLVGTPEIVLLLGGAIENVALPNHHDAAHDRPRKRLPDVSDDQRVQNVAVAVEDVEAEGAAAPRVLVDVVLHELHALHWIHDAEFVHYARAALHSAYSFAHCL